MNYPAYLFNQLSDKLNQNAPISEVESLLIELISYTAARDEGQLLASLEPEAMHLCSELIPLTESYGFQLRSRPIEGGMGLFLERLPRIGLFEGSMIREAQPSSDWMTVCAA